jgi:hypothetical protein
VIVIGGGCAGILVRSGATPSATPICVPLIAADDGEAGRREPRHFYLCRCPAAGLYTYVLDDGEAERQLVFTAARRFCPAVLTAPRAATTPDTELALGCAARSLTDVLSLPSAELSALVWA